MKKRFLRALALLAVCLIAFSGCSDGRGSALHAHNFTEKLATEEYLKAVATCNSKAEYYLSCNCGAKGEETFEQGNTVPHDFSATVEAEKYIKDPATCKTVATYYKSCVLCGQKGTTKTTFQGSSLGTHTLSVEDPHGKYIKTEATRDAAAVYYKSCVCGMTGEETFSFGDKLRDYTDREKRSYKPTSLTVTLYDVENRIYGFTYNTDERPLRPVIRVSEAASAPDSYKEYPCSVEEAYTYDDRDVRYTYYIVKAEVPMDDKKTYSYYAYDKYADVGTDVATITTKDLNSTSFSFAHVSDSQADTQIGGSYFGQVLSKLVGNTDFVLHTGDIVQNSQYESEWDSMLDGNFEYLSQIPIMVSSGNHETYGSSAAYKHFNNKLPSQESTSLGYFYSFVYGNAKFIMLNTNELTNIGHLKDEQYYWLIDELENNDCDWTIVTMHNPLYSIGKWGSDSERNAISLSLRNQLHQIFADYGVDLVLQGHDHAISRTYPIGAFGNVQAENHQNVNGINYSVDPSGVIYVMNGPAGPQSRDPFNTYDSSYYAYAKGSKSRSWAEFSITGNMLTVTVKYVNGSSASVYEQWGIMKSE